jgi:hypothetical protein
VVPGTRFRSDSPRSCEILTLAPPASSVKAPNWPVGKARVRKCKRVEFVLFKVYEKLVEDFFVCPDKAARATRTAVSGRSGRGVRTTARSRARRVGLDQQGVDEHDRGLQRGLARRQACHPIPRPIVRQAQPQATWRCRLGKIATSRPTARLAFLTAQETVDTSRQAGAGQDLTGHDVRVGVGGSGRAPAGGPGRPGTGRWSADRPAVPVPPGASHQVTKRAQRAS